MLINNRKNISKIQLVFFVLVAILFCMFVLAVPRISIPLSLAYILSLALNPMVSASISLGFTKMNSIIIIFIILATLVGLPLVKIIPVLTNESQNLHYSIPRIEQYFISQYEVLRIVVREKSGYEIGDAYVFQVLEEAKNWIGTVVVKIPNYMANLMEWIFLVPFFTFFILPIPMIVLLSTGFFET